MSTLYFGFGIVGSKNIELNPMSIKDIHILIIDRWLFTLPARNLSSTLYVFLSFSKSNKSYKKYSLHDARFAVKHSPKDSRLVHKHTSIGG